MPKCKSYCIAVAIDFAVAEVGVAKYIVTIIIIFSLTPHLA